MTTKAQFKIPILATSVGAATIDVAVFDFATAGPGGQNLDNCQATFKSVITFQTLSGGFGMAMREDALAKRISGTVSVIAANDTYGVGDTLLRSGDPEVIDNWGSTVYTVSGSQVILRITMNSGAGSILYGGLMSGFVEA
jgi:hypothetical protein